MVLFSQQGHIDQSNPADIKFNLIGPCDLDLYMAKFAV